MSIPGNYYKI
ncbi:uncharacterized protein FFM5_04387 [Fusarium fujikuroi]|nr:uncharacterized protein FFM5_04387 [Fusarium fujikuroi]